MPKKKEYFKLTVDCNQSEYVAEAIVEKERIEEMKRRCIKSVTDFVEDECESFTFNAIVEPTTDKPVEGVDIRLRKETTINIVEEGVDYVDLPKDE